MRPQVHELARRAVEPVVVAHPRVLPGPRRQGAAETEPGDHREEPLRVPPVDEELELVAARRSSRGHRVAAAVAVADRLRRQLGSQLADQVGNRSDRRRLVLQTAGAVAVARPGVRRGQAAPDGGERDRHGAPPTCAGDPASEVRSARGSGWGSAGGVSVSRLGSEDAISSSESISQVCFLSSAL